MANRRRPHRREDRSHHARAGGHDRTGHGIRRGRAGTSIQSRGRGERAARSQPQTQKPTALSLTADAFPNRPARLERTMRSARIARCNPTCPLISTVRRAQRGGRRGCFRRGSRRYHADHVGGVAPDLVSTKILE